MDFMSTDFDLAENIFYFHNLELKSLSFVLDWDTDERFYFNLLTKSFADVLDIPNDHSMVLARRQTNYFHKKIPAFDIRYIEDCFTTKDYPDPTKYLIKKTSPANYTKDDIFDCWLYQNKSWADLVSIPGNKNNNCEIQVKSSSSNSISQITSSNNDYDDFIFSNNSRKATSSKNSNNDCNDIILSNNLQKATSSKNSDDDYDDFLFSKNSQKATTSKKSTRMPYSHKEETSIVNYIIKNNYFFNVTGVNMWQQMERDNVCRLRTWQSMKQRYLKHIKYDLNSGNHRFPFLTSKELKLLRQGLKIEKSSKDYQEALKSQFNDKRIDNWESDNS